jgi:hypothetical protein
LNEKVTKNQGASNYPCTLNFSLNSIEVTYFAPMKNSERKIKTQAPSMNLYEKLIHTRPCSTKRQGQRTKSNTSRPLKNNDKNQGGFKAEALS